MYSLIGQSRLARHVRSEIRGLFEECEKKKSEKEKERCAAYG